MYIYICDVYIYYIYIYTQYIYRQTHYSIHDIAAFSSLDDHATVLLKFRMLVLFWFFHGLDKGASLGNPGNQPTPIHFDTSITRP